MPAWPRTPKLRSAGRHNFAGRKERTDVSRIVSSFGVAAAKAVRTFGTVRPQSEMHVLVMAKAPRPGKVKTRLCPPCSPHEAASIAEAALRDTLEAVAHSDAGRRIVALDGAPGPWLPSGFEIIDQCDGSFDRRLAHAWTEAGGPGLQIGMDTPQITPDLLNHALVTLDSPGTDGVLGGTVDGGWWAIGLRAPSPAVFQGVPMSTSRTCEHQLARLDALGLALRRLPVLRDLDTFEDALHHAVHHPSTRAAALIRSLAVRTALR